jgi:Spy/CpxP family protein refolding chaperone
MSKPRHYRRLAACSLVVALAGMAPAAQADVLGPGYIYAPFMMGADGMGPGWGGYGMGPGWGGPGMGPGWGGYGMGQGYGMGPGWGAYGMGPGAGHPMGPGSGGYGLGSAWHLPGMGNMMGGGMPGPRWVIALELTAEQQASIKKIHDEARKANWALLGELLNQQATLRDLYLAPSRDNDAIVAASKEIDNLRQRMIDTATEAHKTMRAVLTAEQVEKLQNLWHRRGAPAN